MALTNEPEAAVISLTAGFPGLDVNRESPGSRCAGCEGAMGGRESGVPDRHSGGRIALHVGDRVPDPVTGIARLALRLLAAS